MNVIISKQKYTHGGYKCFPDFDSAYSTGLSWGDVDCLIFNSAKSDDVDSILELTQISETVKKMIYINNEINPLYYNLFSGMGADIYNDDSLLEDYTTLNYLISEYKNTGMTVSTPVTDVEKISKFVSTLSQESPDKLAKLVKNDVWLKTLQASVGNVETALTRIEDANVSMVQMFNRTSEIISTLETGHAKTSEEIEKLTKFLEETEQKSLSSKGNSVFIFSTYSVPVTATKVLYIRVYSPCSYLYSFIDMYRHYLKMSKQVQSKMLVCVPKLKQMIKKYEGFPRLSQETLATKNIATQGDVFVSHEPKPQVLTAFFGMKTDIHIVIDMLYGDTLLSGVKVLELGAVSSITDIKRFGLTSNKTILSSLGLTTSIVIPQISNYSYTKGPKGVVPNNATTKQTLYFNYCEKDAYAKIDALLFK